MLSESEIETENRKSILKKSDGKLLKKNVSILDDFSIINSISNNAMEIDNDRRDLYSFNESDLQSANEERKFSDRSTSPIYKFAMEEFLSTIDANDLNRINEYEMIEEIAGCNKLRNASCNTYYTNDISTLHQAVSGSQDKKKTKEERKKEREKKKEEEMLKKYQIEQEANHKAIAKSKCGRWVKFNIKIGEGGYKFVYRGYDVEEAKNVAWCEFKREHVDTKEKRQSMFRETEIMLKMNHSHIVRCFDVLREWHVYEDPQTTMEEKGIVIIQELMGEGTLKNVIKKNFLEGQCILKLTLITHWWHQILDALRYMHQKCDPPIIHRDLKADNCFLYGQTDDEYLNVKVGDFGLATHVHTSGRKTMLGTLGFMAPEIFDEKYDESVDIYAFGMLMLEVMTNRTPFDECDTIVQVAAKTLSGKGPKVIEMVGDKWLREIINSCIHPISSFRPTAEELFFHPIFNPPKGLPVEVELNYDNISDRTEVIDRFIANIPNCMKINLRLRFRERRMLQELGLDDGESLEFDLDIYKAEDQDIPDLIQNLRLEYEDKLTRVYDNPKIQDKSTIGAHLDRLFLSIKLQMQCLVKHLLGRRWRDILDSLVANKNAKITEGEMESGDDQDEDCMNSFTIISQYKGMWTKAKRALDKEILAYRDQSHKDPNAPIQNQFNSVLVEGKSSSNSTQESFAVVETETLENEKALVFENVTVKSAAPSIVDGFLPHLNTNSDNDQMESPNIIPGHLSNIDCQPVVSLHGSSIISTTNSNSITMIDNHETIREINSLDTVKDNDNCEQIAQKEIWTVQKNGSYYVKVQHIDFDIYPNVFHVFFSVETPDFSKSESGKWLFCFKCTINENSIINTLEFNAIDAVADKMEHDAILALKETLVRILKFIRNDSNSVPINQNFVFYPIQENIFFNEPVYEINNHKGNIYSHVPNQDPVLNEDQFFQCSTVKQADNKPTLNDNPNVEIPLNIESLFDQESTILLTRRLEDDKYVTRSYAIPCASAFVINNNGSVQNIKRTTIISPKLEHNEDIFVRELDNSDLSMDKAIHILSLLQGKIEESSKDIQVNELVSKIICETKQTQDAIKKPDLVDSFDKNTILEQVSEQKTEIEKLQRQLCGLFSILSNQQIIQHPNEVEQNTINKGIPNSDQEAMNLHLTNKKFASSYGQQFVNPNQMMMNDTRLYKPNNMYITPDELEYQNQNFMIDNQMRNQMNFVKTPMNENHIYSTNASAVENNLRLKGMKELPNFGEVNRTFSDVSNACCYSNDRMEFVELNNIYHFHGNEPISEEHHCKINPASSVPNIQERLSEYQSSDTLTQIYHTKIPYYYPIQYSNSRNEHANYMTLKEPKINFGVPQQIASFYEPPRFVNKSYQNPEEITINRNDGILGDKQQIQNEASMYPVNNNLPAAENANINYHDSNFSISQKPIDIASDACTNLSLDDNKNKDVFNNR